MASESEPISLESEIFDEGPAYLSGEYLIQEDFVLLVT